MQRLYKFFRKYRAAAVAVLLSVVLLSHSMPQLLFAVAESVVSGTQSIQAEQTEYLPAFDMGAGETTDCGESYIEFEDIAKREVNAKHFFMSDGTYTKETYATPVHFRDDADNWQEIDNSLMLCKQGGDPAFRNAGNDFSAVFAQRASQDRPLMSVSKDDHFLNFFVLPAGNAGKTSAFFVQGEQENTFKPHFSAAEVRVKPEYLFQKDKQQKTYRDQKLERGAGIDRLYSTLTYPSLFEDTDFSYEIEPDRVKENIIVRKPQQAYTYAFRLQAGGLDLYLLESGAIAARSDEGRIVFNIPPPFMVDSAGGRSEAVSYSLSQETNGDYLLDIIADADWINADGRVFPVTIDPIVEIVQEYAQMVRAFTAKIVGSRVDSFSALENVGRSGTDLYRIFLSVGSSRLSVYGQTLEYTANSTQRTVEVHRMQRMLSAGESIQAGDDFNFIGATRSLSGSVDLPFDTTLSDQTYCIRLQNETSGMVSIRNIKYREKYVEPHGLKQSFQPETFENDEFIVYAKALDLGILAVVPLYSADAPVLPISVSAVHYAGLSAFRQKFFPEAVNCYGYDVKLTYEQYMAAGDAAKTYYAYLDAEGTEYLFLKAAADRYICQELELEYNSVTRTVTNKLNQTTMVFDPSGRLIKIQNERAQYLIITYEPLTNRIRFIEKVLDSGTNSVVQSIRFSYAGHMLAYVVHGQTAMASLVYDGERGQLTTVYKPDYAPVRIEYDTAGRLSLITNGQNTGYQLSRSASDIKLFNYSKGQTYGYTEIRSSLARRTIHEYDAAGIRQRTRTLVFDNFKGACTADITEVYSALAARPPAMTLTTSMEDRSDQTYMKFHTLSAGFDAKVKYLENRSVSKGSSAGFTITEEAMLPYDHPAVIARFQGCTVYAKERISYRYAGSAGTVEKTVSTGPGGGYYILPLPGRMEDVTVTWTHLGCSCKTETGKAVYFGLGEMYAATTVQTKRLPIGAGIEDAGERVSTTVTPTETKTVEIDRYGRVTKETVIAASQIASPAWTEYTYAPGSFELAGIRDSNLTQVGYVRAPSTGYVEEIRTAYGPAGSKQKLESFRYDALGAQTSYNDSDGNLYEYVHEMVGQSGKYKLTEVRINGVLKESYGYTNDGRPSYVQNGKGTVSKIMNGGEEVGVSAYSSYHYDAYDSGQLSHIRKDGRSMVGYTYYADGNIREKQFANGQSERYSYDALSNRRTYSIYEDGSQQRNYQFQYNDDSDLAYVQLNQTRKNYSHSYTYGSVFLREEWPSWNYSKEYEVQRRSGLTTNVNYSINGNARYYNIAKDLLKGKTIGEQNGRGTTYLNSRYTYLADGNLSEYKLTPSWRTNTYYSRTYQYGLKQSGGSYYHDNRVAKITEKAYDANTMHPVTSIYDIGYVPDGGGAGSIGTVRRDGAEQVRYEYDSANRLVQEFNHTLGRAYSYRYDANNNISLVVTRTNSGSAELRRDVYAYGADGNFTVRTTGEGAGVRNYYTDAQGNHTQYGGLSLQWTQGAKLEKVTSGAGQYTYSYDEAGNRIEKRFYNSAAGTTQTTRYFTEGPAVIAEQTGSKLTQYYFDETGPVAMDIGGTYYYYIKDVFGNIVKVKNAAHTTVAEYAYDAWGNCAILRDTAGIARANPYRYRGYYLDSETGFYHLQTRFYDPALRRFISADNYELVPSLAHIIGELNMFSYANNNPVMVTDPTGESAWHWVAGLALIAALGLTAVLTGGFSVGAGMYAMMAASAFQGAVIGAVSGAVIGGITGGIVSAITGGNVMQGIADGMSAGFLSGAVSGAIMGAMAGKMQFQNSKPINMYKEQAKRKYTPAEKGAFGEQTMNKKLRLSGEKYRFTDSNKMNRVVDGIAKDGTFIAEAKNKASQSMTRQIASYYQHAQANNLDFYLVIQEGGAVTKAIENSSIIVLRIIPPM